MLSLSKKSKRARPKQTRRPVLEGLEGRLAPANVYVVTGPGDSGFGTLRDAINSANQDNTAGVYTIEFQLPLINIGGFVFVPRIQPNSALPAITRNSVTIDGTSQPGYNGFPLVVLDGTNAGSASDGLDLGSNNDTVKALAIVNFSNNGIEITGNANLIESNYLGTADGQTPSPNGTSTIFGPEGAGVLIDKGASGNTIGGTAAGAGNIISGNTDFGVHIIAGSTGNLVQDNFIGTNVFGTNALPNSFGVDISASGNTIGGTVAGSGNVISGNNLDGVVITNSASSNLVQGNYIGTNANATAPVPNGDGLIGSFSAGVLIELGASDNIIGGTTAPAANTISGNIGAGVDLTGVNVTGNQVEGNYIGTNTAGTSLPNTDGVVIEIAGSDNTIGGTAQGAGNTIFDNTHDGVQITLADRTSGVTGNLVQGNTIGKNGTGVEIAGATGNWVQGNYIGTNADSETGLGNGTGVLIDSGASGNTIGGTTAGAGNVISGNNADGVDIKGASTGNLVQGNFIGINVSGTTALPNARSGVVIEDTASGNTIGGSVAGARNIISGNALAGVTIFNSASSNLVQGNQISSNGRGVVLGIDATGNQVEGNYIGTNAAGSSLPNTDGVVIESGASGNTIGGTAPGAGNTIFDNTHDGVEITLEGVGNAATGNQVQGNTIGKNGTGVEIAGANGNLVQGNFIGTNAGSETGLGNGTGVLLDFGASGNTIGGPAAAARNTISGNAVAGVDITDSGTMSNLVQGNLIGTNAGGTSALPNQFGVVIARKASGNTIGGTTTGAGNTISGNTQDGVEILDTGTMDNLVQSNFIGTDATGTVALANTTGVLIENGASGNTIGGVAAGNIIAYNAGPGVQVETGATSSPPVGNAIRANAIFGNSALGIELGTAGVTHNSPGPHTGPNDLQNYPVLNPYTTPGVLTGTLNSTANRTFQLEFFANPAPNPSGQDLLGSLSVSTDPLGNASFTFSFGPFPGEPFLTATATDPSGNTSEFSAAADAALTPTGQNLAATEDAPFSGVVATFTDADPAGTVSDYSASITWGDGTTSIGTIGIGTNGFTVTDTHTYTEEGNQAVTVTITDAPGKTQFTAHSTASVADAPLSATGVARFAVTGGLQFTHLMATFTDGDPAGTVNDYSASIAWGDGTTSVGTIGTSASGFTVTGTHTYPAGSGANFVPIVTVKDAGGSTTTATDNIHDPTRNQLFVLQLYQDLLGRDADAAGLASWSGQLDSGAMTRTQVATAIAGSMEYRSDEVQALYQHYLHRPADAGGLATFVGFLDSGGTVEQVAAIIVGSPEYYAVRGGNTTTGFLTALYQDALNRLPDAAGAAVFTQALGQGLSRGQVAAAVFTSAEYRQDLVQADYLTWLNRPADPSGLNGFMAGLAGGLRDEMLTATLLGSDEFFSRLGSSVG
jgi:titin